MTKQSADICVLTSSPAPEKFHRADLDCAIRLGWLSGIDLGRIEKLRTLPRRERPNGL
jgi:hypothetical protein